MRLVYQRPAESSTLASTRLFANPRKMDVGGEGVSFAKELLKHSLLSATDEFDLSRQYKLGFYIQNQITQKEKELGRVPTDLEVAESLEIEEVKPSRALLIVVPSSSLHFTSLPRISNSS